MNESPDNPQDVPPQYVGHLVPRIIEVMTLLQADCPPTYYPPDSGRQETPYPNGWQYGGTKPDGNELIDNDGMPAANWYIGESYLKQGMPWRVVWLPPPLGQERFVRGDSIGHHPYHEQFGGGEGGASTGAYRKIGTRISLVTVDLWCSDWSDMDVLVHWMTSSILQTNAGALEGIGIEPLQSGGIVPLEAGQRGVRYQLQANFGYPIVAPYGAGSLMRGRGRSVGIRVNSLPVAPPAATEVCIPPSPLDESPWRKPWK